jgi:mannosyltransferase OCH1-like enzyme
MSRLLIFVIFIVIILFILIVLTNFSTAFRAEIPIIEDFKNIPKIIHQTWDSWDSLPPCCYVVIDRVKKMNKDWEYRFYDKSQRRQLIVENFEERIVEAFDKLPTTTMQADLFRLCCLFVYGGFYMDCKSECGSLSSINIDNKLLYCKWSYGMLRSDHPRHAATSFLLWPKKHSVLKDIIDEITKRVHSSNRDHMRKNVTWTTGPNVYSTIVWKKIPKKWIYYTEDYLNGFFIHDGTNGEYYSYMKSRNLHWSQQGDSIR